MTTSVVVGFQPALQNVTLACRCPMLGANALRIRSVSSRVLGLSRTTKLLFYTAWMFAVGLWLQNLSLSLLLLQQLLSSVGRWSVSRS